MLSLLVSSKTVPEIHPDGMTLGIVLIPGATVVGDFVTAGDADTGTLEDPGAPETGTDEDPGDEESGPLDDPGDAEVGTVVDPGATDVVGAEEDPTKVGADVVGDRSSTKLLPLDVSPSLRSTWIRLSFGPSVSETSINPSGLNSTTS